MTINYVQDMLCDIGNDGLDENLRQLANDDAALLEQLGISNDRERNLVFYLDHFLDELCEELNFPIPKNREKVITDAFKELRNNKDIGLIDIRSALFRALGGKRTKVAYPNVTGVMESNVKPRRDVSKWVKVLGDIHAAERIGESRDSVLRRLTEEWDPVEKLDFQSWMRYYEQGNHEKYADLAPMPTQIPLATPQRGRPKDDSRSPEDNKKALIGRLDSAKKLLRNFAPIWPAERWNSIYRALADLEQEIISLRTTASMRDRIIRTANIWTKAGFPEGANTLFKIAQPPSDDVASQIEKALTGREYETKPETPPDATGMPSLPTDIPAPTDTAAMPPEGAPPLEVPPEAGSLPEPPTPPPMPEPEPEKQINKDENPFAGATSKDILDILEPLLKKFKEREVVRQLSKADMMMDALNIVSYFPELGEAIGRLIETDTYVGNRLEKIIGKLRGGLRDESENKKPSPPSIDMGPSPQPEETAVKVSEKPTEKTPAVEETAQTVKEPMAPTPGV